MDVSEARVFIAGGRWPLAAGEIVTSAACAETTTAPIDWVQLANVEYFTIPSSHTQCPKRMDARLM